MPLVIPRLDRDSACLDSTMVLSMNEGTGQLVRRNIPELTQQELKQECCQPTLKPTFDPTSFGLDLDNTPYVKIIVITPHLFYLKVNPLQNS